MGKVEKFIQKINAGEAKVLTLAAAKELKGKRISWMYFGDSANINTVSEMVVGDVISSFDYYKTQPCDGYSSRSEDWESYMTEKQLDEQKTNLLLLDSDGNNTCMIAYSYNNFFDELTFTCSDADRAIYYLVENEKD